MPMAVAPNKRFLYAVVRSQPMRVLTYAIDGKSGALTQKATAPLPDSMAYVSTDRGGRFLFTASYGSDKVAVSPIDEDGLVTAEPIQVLPTGRNAHSILADRTNRFVYSAILGANEVMQFAFDANSGKLAPLDPPAVTLEPGHGPRHLALSRRQQIPVRAERAVRLRRVIRDRRRERHLEAHRLGAVSAA